MRVCVCVCVCVRERVRGQTFFQVDFPKKSHLNILREKLPSPFLIFFSNFYQLLAGMSCFCKMDHVLVLNKLQNFKETLNIALFHCKTTKCYKIKFVKFLKG